MTAWRPPLRWASPGGPDPGRLRLRAAVRAMLSVALTAGALATLVALGRLPVVAAAVGASFALMGATLPREAAPPARFRTLLVMAAAAALSTLGSLVLALWPLAAEAAFLASVVATVAFQSLGPRYVAAGVIVLLEIYLVLFLKGPLSAALPAMLALGLALSVLLVLWFVVLPETPRAAFGRILVSVRASGARLLRAVASPGTDEGPRRRARLRELNATILAAEDQLGVFDPDGRSGLGSALLRFELALTDVAAAAVRAPLARADQARVRLAAMRLRANKRTALHRASGETPALRLALAHLETAAAELADARGVMEALNETAAPPARKPASPRPALAWQPALRAGAAALLAMAGGYALSPNRWFWSVQTAYLMFLGTRSRGDTVLRSVQRVWGTLAGLVAGLGASALLSAHPVAQGTGLVLCLFALAYVFGASQTLSVFFITVLLSLAYTLGGAATESVLVLRLEETVIGAAAAVLVGLVLLPKPTEDYVAEQGRRALGALADLVRVSRRRLDGDTSAGPAGAMRQADRAVRDLRLALAPLRAGSALTPWSAPKADLPTFLSCVFWARHLAAESEDAGNHATEPLCAQLERIAAKLDALAAAKTHHEAPLDTDTPTAEIQSSELIVAADSLEAAVDRLGQRLHAVGWAAFAHQHPV